MPPAVTVRINTREFTPTLKKYAALSKRTPAEICNRKAYMINRRFIWNVRKAQAEDIKQELGAHDAFNLVINKSGKRKGKFSMAKKHATFIFDKTASGAGGRFERIIIARLRKAGKHIPKGEAMAELMVKTLKARLRSIAFLASGAIPAREQFKNWCRAHGVPIGKAGMPPQPGSGIGGPKQVGQPKGGARPANFNWFTKATFFNAASAKHDTKGALQKYGMPAMEKAFSDETQDTLLEIEKRLKQKARSAGIRVA